MTATTLTVALSCFGWGLCERRRERGGDTESILRADFMSLYMPEDICYCSASHEMQFSRNARFPCT